MEEEAYSIENLELAREAKRRDVSIDAEQELAVLSSDTTEQQGFIPSTQRELGRRMCGSE